MIETFINFGGFYHSIHSDIIEMAEERENEYFEEKRKYLKRPDSEEIQLFEYMDFKKIHNNYIKIYCDLLENFIFDNYKVKIKFKNISLHSPQYYNYSTDRIETKIKRNQALNLTNILKKENDFLKYLEDRTTSYDGYISHYSYDEALNDKNDILISYALEFVSDQLNHDELYYKINYVEIAYNDEGEKIFSEIYDNEQIEEEYNKKQMKLAV